MLDNKIVVLPCAGNGSRLKSDFPKQYQRIGNKTILEHTLEVFLPLEQISKIVIVISPTDKYIDKILSNVNPKISILKVGGETRAHTVKNALNTLECLDKDWVLVHDVARCCITRQKILDLIKHLEQDEVGGILAIPATDTIKLSATGGEIDQTLERETIYHAQTPQMFRYSILKHALNNADLARVTDEASSIEQLKLPVKLVRGETTNIKVTYPLDLKIAELFLNIK